MVKYLDSNSAFARPCGRVIRTGSPLLRSACFIQRAQYYVIKRAQYYVKDTLPQQ